MTDEYFVLIRSRETFDIALEQAIEATARLKVERSGTWYWGTLCSIELQLYAIKYWMRDGGVPTMEQRAAMTLARQVARAIEDPPEGDDELAAYKIVVEDIGLYVRHLPPDDPGGGWREENRWPRDRGLRDVEAALREVSPEEKRRLLELDDIPYPEGVGFPDQPKP